MSAKLDVVPLTSPRAADAEELTEPAGVPVAEPAVVHHTPVAVPRSAR